jgi:hypothetical protein
MCHSIIPNNKILHIKCAGRKGQNKKERKTYNQANKDYSYIVTQVQEFPKETDMG